MLILYKCYISYSVLELYECNILPVSYNVLIDVLIVLIRFFKQYKNFNPGTSIML